MSITKALYIVKIEPVVFYDFDNLPATISLKK